MVGKFRRPRLTLRLEPLEPRDVPAVFAESFDGTAAGALPGGWSQWGSAGGTPWAVASSPSVSAPNSLGVTGGSSVNARAWYATPQPADVQVAADVYLSTLIPA